MAYGFKSNRVMPHKRSSKGKSLLKPKKELLSPKKEKDLLSSNNKILEGTINDIICYGHHLDKTIAPIDQWINLWRNDPEFRKWIISDDETIRYKRKHPILYQDKRKRSFIV